MGEVKNALGQSEYKILESTIFQVINNLMNQFDFWHTDERNWMSQHGFLHADIDFRKVKSDLVADCRILKTTLNISKKMRPINLTFGMLIAIQGSLNI